MTTRKTTMAKLWRIWAKALGEKVGTNNEADKVAWVRTFLILQAIVTNMFIISNAVRHW